MIKPKRIKDVCLCTIGQMYLLVNSREATSVRCTALTEDNRIEIDKGGYKRTIDLSSKYESDHIYEHNASFKIKYNRLLEQHKHELKDLIEGKEVIVYNLSELEQKEKWYNKLWKRLNKKYKH